MINFDKLLKYKKEFLLYIIAGFLCAVINWVVFYLLSYKFQIKYTPSAIISFFVSATVNFLLCKIIFTSKGLKKRIEFLLVVIASFVAVCIDISVMNVFIYYSFPPICAKILGTGFAFIFNYVFRQFFIFKK